MEHATGGTEVSYDGRTINFGAIRQFSMRETLVEFWQGEDKATLANVKDAEWLLKHSREKTAAPRWWNCSSGTCDIPQWDDVKLLTHFTYLTFASGTKHTNSGACQLAFLFGFKGVAAFTPKLSIVFCKLGLSVPLSGCQAGGGLT